LVRLPGWNDDLELLLVGAFSTLTAAGTLLSRSHSTTMRTSTLADLSELLSIEAEAAREAWEEALHLEQEGFLLDPIHLPLAATLLLGLVPMGVRDLGAELLAEGKRVSA
jgi:hypothetical protein